MDDVELEAVARGAAADAGGLGTELLGGYLATVVDAADSGRRLRSVELDACSERGAAAALAGVPLRATIDLYLSACWRLWQELPIVRAGSAAQVRAAGLAVLRAADDGVAAVAEGYQLARGDLSRRQEAERRDVLDALLEGGAVAGAVLGRAADLGLGLASPHAVLVARRDDAFEGGAATAVAGRVERALAGRLGDSQPLVAVRGGLLVCVFAAPEPAAVEQVAARVAGVLAAVSGTARWQAAVGRSLPGAQGVRVSYEQARDSLDFAARLGLDTPVVDSAELAVYRVLLRDRAAMAELIATVLGPLATARGGAGPLLLTLDAYFAAGGVSTEAARRLHLSVRAVTYRLARVADLLGRDPTDPAGRFALHAAVLGARLLDWPVVPLET